MLTESLSINGSSKIYEGKYIQLYRSKYFGSFARDILGGFVSQNTSEFCPSGQTEPDITSFNQYFEQTNETNS